MAPTRGLQWDWGDPVPPGREEVVVVLRAAPERTVPGLLAIAGSGEAAVPALVTDEGTIPFGGLEEVASRAAGTLAALGVGPGDRVVVIGANCLPLMEVFLGCAWLGAVFAPLNPQSPTAQLRQVIPYLDPAVVLADPPVDLAGLATARPTVLGGLLQPAASGPVWSLGEPVGPAPVRPDTPLSILMTSGTTGVSKGVVCPHGQFIQWGRSVGGVLGLDRGDVAYTCLPLFHTNALNGFMQTLTFGATYHVGPRFSVSRFFDRIRAADASVSYLLGAMVGMLLSTEPGPGDRQHRLTRILAPGTPVAMVEPFEQRFGVELIEGHGMTETNLTIAPPRGERRPGFMGVAVEGFDVRVVDESGADVAPGVPGELLLRTSLPDAFATGYWQMPEVTQAAYRGGWFHSGDRVVAEDGWYRFLDRLKDVIRRRGENISAWEVEQALDSHPHVVQSAVVPVPSDLGEDEVMAFVRLHDSVSVDPDTLLDHVRQTLPKFAVPRYVEFVTEFPLTDTGKVRKQLLRDRGVGDATWDAQEVLRGSDR